MVLASLATEPGRGPGKTPMMTHVLPAIRAGGVAAVLALAAGVAPAILPGMATAAAQTPAAQILISETDGALASYAVVGPVSATVHQKSLFPSTPSRVLLDRELQAEAAKLGADAVIQVRYDMTNAATSRDGHKAIGVAVKYAAQPATQMAQAPVAAAAAPPALAQPAAPSAPVQMAEAAPVTPPVATVPAAPPPQQQPMPYTPAAPMPVGTPGQILLSEHDIPQRPHQRLGEISVKTHQASLFPKDSPAEQLNAALRAEAAKLGADAVIMVKYSFSNAMFSRKGNTATGVAVKFQ